MCKRPNLTSLSASGLGRATALELAQHGANISILDLNEENGAELVKQLGGESRAKFFQVDVTETKTIEAAVKGTVEWVEKTKAPLGGIIPAAGVGIAGLILDGKNRPLAMQSFDTVLNINLRGTIDLVRQFLPYLSKSPAFSTPSGDAEHGVVIMVASAAAFDGQMGQVAYAASKGAVAAMTLPMTRDLSRFGIRVVTIAPGTFETPMTAMMSDKVRASLEKSMEFPKRGGTGEEFAGVVRACVENVYLNGCVIRLDGGSRMPSRL